MSPRHAPLRALLVVLLLPLPVAAATPPAATLADSPSPLPHGFARLLTLTASAAPSLVAVDEGTVGSPLPAGDMDGDGTADLLVLESFSRLRARSGATGASLWARSAEPLGAYAAVGGTPDATGDGAADVLVLTRARVAPGEVGAHVWRVALLSGAAGADAWSRAYPGQRLANVETNALVVPYLSDERVLVNAVDTYSFGVNAGICAGVPWFWWECYASADARAWGSRTRAHVLDASGEEVARRESTPTSALALLVPAGRAHGGARADFIWQETEGGTAARACVNPPTCPPPDGVRNLVLEGLDGASFAPVWRRELGDVVGIVEISGLDATADGRDDLLVRGWETPPASWMSPRPFRALLDGPSGATLWTRPSWEDAAAAIGAVGGGAGADFLFGSHLRVDGATGATLLQATSGPVVREWPCRAAAWETTADVDGDGVRDIARHHVCEKPRSDLPLIGTNCRTLAEPGLLGVLVVESGATATRLLARDYGPSRCGVFARAAGDLDGDGGEDFLLKADVEAQDVVEALAASNRTLWLRAEGARWPEPFRGDDRSGDGLADPFARAWDVGGRRLELWSGSDGRTVWTVA